MTKSCFYCGSTAAMPVLKAYEAGRDFEQERIIKLLEEAMLEQDEPITKDFAIGAIWAVNEAIALIKGEK